MNKNLIVQAELNKIQNSLNRIADFEKEDLDVQEPTDRFLSQAEAAKFLKITQATLIKYRKQGKVQFRQIGKRIIYRVSDLINIA